MYDDSDYFNDDNGNESIDSEDPVPKRIISSRSGDRVLGNSASVSRSSASVRGGGGTGVGLNVSSLGGGGGGGGGGLNVSSLGGGGGGGGEINIEVESIFRVFSEKFDYLRRNTFFGDLKKEKGISSFKLNKNTVANLTTEELGNL